MLPAVTSNLVPYSGKFKIIVIIMYQQQLKKKEKVLAAVTSNLVPYSAKYFLQGLRIKNMLGD